jgi:hypothetical protein
VEETGELELVLTAQHPGLDDDRFGEQVLDLTRELKLEVGGVTTRTSPEPGKRGGLPEIIVALGTSGAVGGAVAVFKAWLDKDKARKISIKVRKKGRAREIEIMASVANVGDLEKLLVAACTQ